MGRLRLMAERGQEGIEKNQSIDQRYSTNPFSGNGKPGAIEI